MPRRKNDNGSRVGELSSGLQTKNKEIGSTGLTHYGGKIYEEFLPSLQGEKGKRVLKEMAENDPTVSAILFAIEMLIRSVSWGADPATPEKEDVERADFLRDCMDDMDRPWSEFISEAMSMLVYGFSTHELVYKIRRGQKSKFDDGKVGWLRMPIRAQDTIDQWIFDDNGSLASVKQLAPPQYRSVEIPIDKILNFRTVSRKDNPEGKSVLRGAYRPWYFKKKIEEYEGIGIERDLCGIPVALVPPQLLDQNATAKDKAILEEVKKIVRNIRMDSQVGIVFPVVYDDRGNQLYKFELLSTAGTKQFNTNDVINRYDQRIAMVVLADFILLGHEKVGSFALASSKTNLFATALGAMMDSIAETLNRDAVPRLFELNGYSGTYPKVVHGDIETPDLDELGRYLTALSGSGMPLFPDDKLERHLRRVANLPEMND